MHRVPDVPALGNVCPPGRDRARADHAQQDADRAAILAASGLSAAVRVAAQIEQRWRRHTCWQERGRATHPGADGDARDGAAVDVGGSLRGRPGHSPPPTTAAASRANARPNRLHHGRRDGSGELPDALAPPLPQWPERGSPCLVARPAWRARPQARQPPHMAKHSSHAQSLRRRGAPLGRHHLGRARRHQGRSATCGGRPWRRWRRHGAWGSPRRARQRRSGHGPPGASPHNRRWYELPRSSWTRHAWPSTRIARSSPNAPTWYDHPDGRRSRPPRAARPASVRVGSTTSA